MQYNWRRRFLPLAMNRVTAHFTPQTPASPRPPKKRASQWFHPDQIAQTYHPKSFSAPSKLQPPTPQAPSPTLRDCKVLGAGGKE